MVSAGLTYTDWESAQGKVLNTTLCSTGRKLLLPSALTNGAIDIQTDDYVPRRRMQRYYEGPHSDPDQLKYSVTYSFTTLNQQNVEATTNYCYNPVPPVGSTETILYNPDNPSVGVVSQNGVQNDSTGGMVMTIIGFVCAVLIVACLINLGSKKTGSNNNNNHNHNSFSNQNTYSDNHHVGA